ncbi:MAG: flavodoxin family protein [Deltaproteobacteria bacterium]|nr:flavodoxin family protein [Deltaproteobacteria bacterium]
MKAVIINGARKGNGTLKIAREVLGDELVKAGWDLEVLDLRKTAIAACLGCFGCWFKTPGVCVINDAGRDVTKAFVQSDMAVFLTPVTFGGYSSEMKKAVDRLIPCISPYFMKINGETHHKPRYERYPKLAVIGEMRLPDMESEGIFKKLVERNAVNMHSPAHASCIVLEEDWSDQVRNKIKKCLSDVGVVK